MKMVLNNKVYYELTIERQNFIKCITGMEIAVNSNLEHGLYLNKNYMYAVENDKITMSELPITVPTVQFIPCELIENIKTLSCNVITIKFHGDLIGITELDSFEDIE